MKTYCLIVLKVMRLILHWEELKSTWKFVDAIQDQWTMVEPCFPNYEAGTNGPLESDLLLSRDGNHWWDDIH